MVQNLKQVGPQRYRETFGRYYEDFEVGDIYEHRPGRTISETDNTWFSLLTMNTHPLHFDAEYAKASEFGRCLVASPFTVALMLGMSVTDVSQKAIANLGWTNIKMTAPLYAGDTLTAESEVLAKRESKSRPDAGIVTVKTRGFNQAKVMVCEFERSILVAPPRRRRCRGEGELLRRIAAFQACLVDDPSRDGERAPAGRVRGSVESRICGCPHPALRPPSPQERGA